VPRQYARPCVLHHHRFAGRYPEPAGRFEEQRRIRLAGQSQAVGEDAVDAYPEKIGEASGGEHRRAVTAGGNHGERD